MLHLIMPWKIYGSYPFHASCHLGNSLIIPSPLIISCLLPGFLTYLLSAASCILPLVCLCAYIGTLPLAYLHIPPCVSLVSLSPLRESTFLSLTAVVLSLVSDRSMELGAINTPCDYLLPPPAIHTLLRL